MNHFKPLLLATALATSAQATLATDWQDSPYGKQDEIGAANLLTPATFATRVRSEARRSAGKVSVTVIDEAGLRKEGCGSGETER